jgi:glycogen phosphorylase
MPYQIQPVKEFLVRPALPPSLNRLSELAYNLLWSWDHSIRSLFRRLDPALWKQSNHNPIQLLGRITQEKLDKAAADPRFVSLYSRFQNDPIADAKRITAIRPSRAPTIATMTISK